MKADYRSKLVSAEAAVAQIGSGAHISMGMAAAEPPALLKALADRVESGALDDLKLWYFHSLPHAATTLLRYELLDRVRPRCMFLSPVERALVVRGEAEGWPVFERGFPVVVYPGETTMHIEVGSNVARAAQRPQIVPAAGTGVTA